MGLQSPKVAPAKWLGTPLKAARACKPDLSAAILDPRNSRSVISPSFSTMVKKLKPAKRVLMAKGVY